MKLFAVGGVVVTALGVALWTTARANGTLRDRIEDLEASVAEQQRVNAANVQQFDDLLVRHNMCVEERRVDTEASQALVAQLQSDLEAIRRRPRIVREEIYRDPSCAELGAIDIAAACPVLAGELRARARSVSSD